MARSPGPGVWVAAVMLIAGFCGAGLASSQPIYIETIGALGSADGQFDTPRGLAVDAMGNLYVADDNNHRIQKFTNTSGTLAHAYSFGAAGTGPGQFTSVHGVAVDSAGNVFVSDPSADRVQKLSPNAGTLQHAYTFGTTGSLPGQFNAPADIAIDTNDDLYVVDISNAHVQVFTQAPTTLNHVTTFTAGGQLNSPKGVAVGADNTLYTVNFEPNTLWSATRLGSVLGVTGSATFGEDRPSSIAVAADGAMYVGLYDLSADKPTLTRLTYDGATLIQTDVYTGPGSSPLTDVSDVAIDEFGNIYLSELFNNRVLRLFDPGAIVPGNTAQLANLLLGASGQQDTMVLPADRGLAVAGSTVVEPGATMTILSDQFTSQNLGVFGGSFTGPLAGIGAMTFISGTLNVTDEAGLNVGTASPPGASLTISAGKTLNVNHALTIDATGTLSMTGGAVGADTLTNDGTLNASGITLTLASAGSVNNGPINLTGNGLRLTNALTNQAEITLTSSILRVDGAFVNEQTGQINATGISNLRFDAGATNEGQINFDGADMIVSGALTNATGTISLLNNAQVTLTGVVVNDAAIDIGDGSAATFENDFSGNGSITGDGLASFSTRVAPGGDGTAVLSIAGDAALQGTLVIQIGGDTPATGYDQLLVGDELVLGGTLSIELINGYTPLSGQSFLIIDAGAGVLTNAFAQVNGLTISPGNTFELVYDETLDQVQLVAPVVLLGDTDGDGDIDDADLGTAFSNFTGPVGATGGKTSAQGDTDSDGDIDDADLGNAFSGFTGPLTPANVPEPASIVLVVSGAALLSRTRYAGRKSARH